MCLTSLTRAASKDVSLEEEVVITDTEDSTLELQPLMRAKLHAGWICDVQLLGASGQCTQGSGSGPLLMTAANDETVALWDISKAGGLDCRPCKVLETCSLHDGESCFSNSFCMTKSTEPTDPKIPMPVHNMSKGGCPVIQ